MRKRSTIVIVAGVASVLALGAQTAAAGGLTVRDRSKAVPSSPQDPDGRTQAGIGCPDSHPHVTGGGISIAKTDFDIQVASTDVFGDGWSGEAINNSGQSTEMNVFAICAKRGRFRYPEADKAGAFGEQVQRGVNCPSGRKLTGGGVDTGLGGARAYRRGGEPAEIASTRPEDGPDANSKPDDRWVGSVANSSMTVTAVCAKRAGTFKYVHSARAPLPNTGSGFARARCPAGAEVTGGGVDTTGIDVGLEINNSDADSSGFHQSWEATATNDTVHDEELQAFAICKV